MPLIKKKWRIRKEREALEERQQQWRNKADELYQAYQVLMDRQAEAILNGDDEEAEKLGKLIGNMEKRITMASNLQKEEQDKIVKDGSVMLNDNARGNNNLNTLFNGLGIASGAGLAMYGLAKAYDADVFGRLVNKGTLMSAKGINPFGFIKRH